MPLQARIALADALHPAFLVAAFVSFVVWIVAVVGVKEVPLKSGFEDAVETAVVKH